MRFTGQCPHCGEPLEFPTAPPPVGTCASCAGRYSIAVPELEGEEQEGVELLVLPIRTASPLDTLLDTRRLKRPILFALIAGAALVAGFVLAGALASAAPAASFSRGLLAFFVLSLVLLPLVGVLSALTVWALFGRQGRSTSGFNAWRSILAMSAGATILLGLQFTAPMFPLLLGIAAAVLFARTRGPGRELEMWRLLLATLVGLATFVVAYYVPTGILDWLFTKESGRAYGRAYSLAILVIGASAAGWITARTGRGAPYRHAIGAGLVVALSPVLIASAFPVPFQEVVTYSLLTAAIYVPLLLFGAWLSARRGSPLIRARAAS